MLTSQVVDFKVITYGEQFGWSNIQRLAKAFQSGLASQFTFQNNGSSAIEQSTYIVAAISAAFRRDLKAEFQQLNFPIDEGLYVAILATLTSYLG